jgi:alpha-amylase/alpha-mannosidase (GH57 family)
MTISSLSLFSQNVTQNQEFIKIPVPVVRKIVVDLVRGDSAIAQLHQSNLMIKQLENKTKVQDSIIVSYKQVDENNQKIISNLERKVEIVETEFKSVSKELRKQKIKSRFTNLLSSGTIVTLLYFVITK